MGANHVQIGLIQDYCASRNLSTREGAKIWVQEYAGRCRELMEEGLEDEESIKGELYKT